MKQFYDKTRRPILNGDVLKVFHFKSGRRNYFMYKVAGIDRGEMCGFCASDLILNEEGRHRYRLGYNANERDIIPDTEILVSGGSDLIEDRQRLPR